MRRERSLQLMSANDFSIHRRQQVDSSPNPAQSWVCVVVATPATPKEYARVRTLHGAAGRAGIELGAAPWVKPSGKEKPEEGDICLVQLDEGGSPWITGWKAQL
jgi:hypothetical protein